MNSLKPILTFFICHLIFLQFSFSQDPQFTQSFAGMTYNNPAFSGSDTMSVIYFSHRNQWPKLAGTYQTTIGGYELYLPKANAYTGFQFMRDNSGPVQTTRLTLNFAQNIKIKKLLIRPAFEGCFFQRELDWTQLTFGDQIDPRTGFAYPSGEQTRGGGTANIDFNTGILINYRNFTFGYSLHHITQPNQSLLTGNSALPLKVGYQMGYDLDIHFGVKSRIQLQPYFMYFSQGYFQSMNFGFNTRINDLILIGFNHRTKDSFAFITGITKYNFRITYCYEITTSTLENSNTGGTHEFSLAFRFWKRKSHTKYLEKNKSWFDSI